MTLLQSSLFVAAALAAGCASQEETSSASIEAGSQIHAVLDGMGTAVQNQDVDAFMNFWAESDSLVYTRQGRTFVGWDEVYADAAQSFPNLGQLTRTQSEVFVNVLAPTSGVATTFTFLSSQREDGSTETAWFTFTAAIARQPDQTWRVVQAHSSYPLSGMSPRGQPENSPR